VCGTGVTVPPSSKRIYCSRKCFYDDETSAWRDGLRTKFKHIISNVDVETKTGDCVSCGRVKVRKRSDTGAWRCCSGELSKNRSRIFGISETEQKELLDTQNNKCAICRISFDGVPSHLDHNHVTGKIRGFLCSGCNTSIGLLKENIDSLKAAILYLEKNLDTE